MFFELEGVINSRDCRFEFFKQVGTNISGERSNIETRLTEISESQSSIYRRDLRASHN